MTVFRFRFFYEIDDDAQERYVVAATENEAWDKLNAYFEKQHGEGLATPCSICNPEVELENVIL